MKIEEGECCNDCEHQVISGDSAVLEMSVYHSANSDDCKKSDDGEVNTPGVMTPKKTEEDIEKEMFADTLDRVIMFENEDENLYEVLDKEKNFTIWRKKVRFLV